jgi:hypothetical protein
LPFYTTESRRRAHWKRERKRKYDGEGSGKGRRSGLLLKSDEEG